MGCLHLGGGFISLVESLHQGVDKFEDGDLVLLLIDPDDEKEGCIPPVNDLVSHILEERALRDGGELVQDLLSSSKREGSADVRPAGGVGLVGNGKKLGECNSLVCALYGYVCVGEVLAAVRYAVCRSGSTGTCCSPRIKHLRTMSASSERTEEA